MKVAVVGAGMSGILTAYTFKQAGHTVVLYDEDTHIGGVWSPSKHYDGLRTQNSGVTYTLPCWDVPKSWHDEYFPTAEEYHAYLQGFVDSHGLGSCMCLGTEVLHASNTTPGQAWLLTIKGPDGTTQQLPFDFLIIAAGQFSKPHIPPFAGIADFTAAGGTILHTSELRDLNGAIAGKRVVLIGNGRSGIDVATNCAKSGVAVSPVTQVYRKARWPMVKHLGKLLFVDNLYATRFAYTIFPACWPSAFRAVMEALMAPLISMFWWMTELMLRLELPLSKFKLVPDGRLHPYNIGCDAAIAPQEMHPLMQQGNLRAIKGEVARFSPGKVHLQGGTCLEADIVIMATGYDKRALCGMLPDDVRAAVWDPADGSMLLHRKIVPLGVPNLAFIGYARTTLSTVVAHLQAAWALAYAEGRLQLPSAKEHASNLGTEWAWAAAKHNGDIAADIRRDGCTFWVSMEYFDVLLRDLGVQDTRLRPNSWFAETFQIVRPQLYRTLLEAAPNGPRASTATRTKASNANISNANANGGISNANANGDSAQARDQVGRPGEAGLGSTPKVPHAGTALRN